MRSRIAPFGLFAMSTCPSLSTSMVLAREQCAEVVTETDAEVQRRFPDLASRVDRALSTRGELDTCARVQLSTAGTYLRVTVTLEDGRQAVRTLAGDTDVVPVVQALLLVPADHDENDESTMAAEASPAPNDSVASSTAVVATPIPVSTSPSPQSTPPRTEAEFDAGSRVQHSTSSNLELAFGTSAQTGDGQSSLGVVLLPRIERWSWLWGIEVKVESTVLTTDPYSTGRLGAIVGHRFVFDGFDFDLFAGPALVAHIGSYTYTERVDSEATPPPEADNPIVIPRFALGGQMPFGGRSALRPFVGLYGELGSTGNVNQNLPGALPALPRWGVGLSMGGVVATP